jgi:hypothetical protein
MKRMRRNEKVSAKYPLVLQLTTNNNNHYTTDIKEISFSTHALTHARKTFVN